MTYRSTNTRWLNSPTHRVGQEHLLHVIRATVGENDPEYRNLKARIEGDETRAAHSAAHRKV